LLTQVSCAIIACTLSVIDYDEPHQISEFVIEFMHHASPVSSLFEPSSDSVMGSASVVVPPGQYEMSARAFLMGNIVRTLLHISRAGIPNGGNDCFWISTIQLLAAGGTRSLYPWLT
jgi:hypothetical protein